MKCEENREKAFHDYPSFLLIVLGLEKNRKDLDLLVIRWKNRRIKSSRFNPARGVFSCYLGCSGKETRRCYCSTEGESMWEIGASLFAYTARWVGRRECVRDERQGFQVMRDLPSLVTARRNNTQTWTVRWWEQSRSIGHNPSRRDSQYSERKCHFKRLAGRSHAGHFARQTLVLPSGHSS